MRIESNQTSANALQLIQQNISKEVAKEEKPMMQQVATQYASAKPASSLPGSGIPTAGEASQALNAVQTLIPANGSEEETGHSLSASRVAALLGL